MAKKFFSIASALTIGALALSGCSGKLSAEETCDRLMQSGQEMNVSAAVQDMLEGVENSDPVGAKMGVEAVKGWLQQAADETADKDFRAALEYNANTLSELVDIQLDSTIDDEEKMQRSQALGNPEHQVFIQNNCPQITELMG